MLSLGNLLSKLNNFIYGFRAKPVPKHLHKYPMFDLLQMSYLLVLFFTPRNLSLYGLNKEGIYESLEFCLLGIIWGQRVNLVLVEREISLNLNMERLQIFQRQRR